MTGVRYLLRMKLAGLDGTCGTWRDLAGPDGTWWDLVGRDGPEGAIILAHS